MLIGGFAFDGGVVVEVVGCGAAKSCWSSIYGVGSMLKRRRT